MHIRSGQRWALSFAIAALLLLANTAIFYYNNQRAIDATKMVGQTRGSLIDLGNVLAVLDEAETGQRGYLLTGDLSYLQPYTTARARVAQQIAELRRLSGADPRNQQAIAQLTALTAAKFNELQETITLQTNQQHAAALQLVLSGRGQQAMNQIRTVIGIMQTTENRLLTQRAADVQGDEQRQTVTLLLASFSDLLLLALLFIVMRRALASRERIAEERERLLVRERAARAEAEATARMREEFLTVAAHELNTPLTALLGSAQLLQQRTQRDGGLAERYQKVINLITSQANRLSLLVSTLLDTSRLQADRLALSHDHLDLVALLLQVMQELQPLSARHPMRLDAPPTPINLIGDKMRLTQVMHNLIQNAIKYSPNGGAIHVAVTQQEGWARITVSDRGMGIPAADISQIFHRLFRASNTNSQAISGIGMGLYVVHGIISHHGGTIEVTSDEDAGSTFIIHLPLERPNTKDAAIMATADGSSAADQATIRRGTHQ